MGVLEGAALARWVNASCVAQGLPLFVTDSGVIARVCALLGGGTQGPGRSRRRRDPAPLRLQAPNGDDPVRVEGSGGSGAGKDSDVVDDGSDDGGLAREVEV